MKRLVLGLIAVFITCLPLCAQVSLSTNLLTWEANETDTKYVTVTGGNWECDSLVYSNHFQLNRNSGNSGTSVAITPLSTVTGDAIEGGIGFYNPGTGSYVVLDLIHNGPSGTFSVSPLTLSWGSSETQSKTVTVTGSGWTSSISGTGFSRVENTSGGTITVTPDGQNTGSARNANLIVSKGESEKYVWLHQDAGSNGSGNGGGGGTPVTSISFNPPALYWEAGRRETKGVYVVSNGAWQVDSLLVENHFSVGTPSGSSGDYLYVTPISTNSGQEVIEGGVDVGGVILPVIHFTVADTLNVAPESLTWEADNMCAKSVSISCPVGWRATLNGVGFTASPLSGSVSGALTVTPIGMNATGNARTATLTILDTTFGHSVSIQLQQAPSGASTPEPLDADDIDYNDYAPGVTIPYSRSVSPSGAMTYSVPIATAPGLKNVPKITLSYNSQGGNGLAGFGWDLDGLSSISIANKTAYYDGVNAPADADSPGAVYVLDGVRLVPNSIASLSSTWQYETTSGHVLVRKHTDADGRALWFEALYPDGSHAIFGDSLATYPSVDYPVSESRDREGNWIKYSYDADVETDTRHPSIVEYGLTGSSTAQAAILFEYVQRTDWHVRYMCGRRMGHSALLNSVTSLNGTDTLRKYSLVHEVRDGVNLLRRIRMTAPASSGTGTVEATPLRFGYGNTGAVEAVTLGPGKGAWINGSFDSNAKFKYVRGKFVPGRYTDGLLLYEEKTDYSGNEYFWTVPALENDYNPARTSFQRGSGFVGIQAVDVDGDGADEIVKTHRYLYSAPTNTSIVSTVYKYADNGVFSANSQTVVNFAWPFGAQLADPALEWGDYLGNGTTQMLMLIYNATDYQANKYTQARLVNLNTGEQVAVSSIFPGEVTGFAGLFTADIEGDGVSELCRITDVGMEVWRASSSGVFSKVRTILGISSSDLSNGREVMLSDLNADGYIDVVVAPTRGSSSSQWKVFSFDGKQFQSFLFSGPVRADGGTEMFMDTDRDGLPDLVTIINDTTLRIWLNANGRISNTYMEFTSTEIAPSGLVPCNIARLNAASSLMMFNGKLVREYRVGPSMTERRHLRRFTNSFGVFSGTRYGYAAEYDGYDPLPEYSPEADSGYVRMAFPAYVVRADATRISRTTPENQQMEARMYSFAGAVFNTRGLGFCGFRRSAVTDLIQPYGLTVTSVSNPQKRGVPESQLTAIGTTGVAPDTLSVSAYTFDNNQTQHGKLNPRLIQSMETDFLAGISTTTTVSGYDAYDYPTGSTTVRGIQGGGSGSISETHTISYSHTISDSLYILGTVREELTRKGALASKTEYTLDSLKRPTRTKTYAGTLSGGNTIWDLTTDRIFTYDAHGNVTSDRMAAYGATTYNESTYVYDNAGRYLTTSTDPLGRTTTYLNYNKYGQPAQQFDWLNRQTLSSYDAWGNLIYKTDPDSTVTAQTIAWSVNGEPGLYCISKTVTGQPDTKVWYDALGREVRSANKRFDGSWQYVTTEYDGRGRLYRTSLPYKNTAIGPTLWNTYTYDNYNRPVSLLEASGKQTTWSYSGTSTTTTKEGMSTTSTTDAEGNVVNVTDAGGTISYTLRDDGQPSYVTVTPAGSNQNIVTSFTYDAYGRRTAIIDPSAGTRSDTYTDNTDGSSSVAHTGPNGTVTTYYDRFGRVTSVTRPEFNTSYTYGTTLYDSSYGKPLIEVSTNGTSRIFTYDGYGRPVTETEHADSTNWLRRTYTYGAGSNIATVNYTTQDGSITTETFTYANGHNTSISATGSGNTTINVFTLTGENALGQPTSVTTGGATRNYGYTSAGIPSMRRIRDTYNNTVQQFTYTYAPASGNMLSRSDAVMGIQETFSYDAQNRLLSATETWEEWTPMDYVYETAATSFNSKGNVTSRTYDGQLSLNICYDNNQNPYEATSASNGDPMSGGYSYTMLGPCVATTSFDRPASVSPVTENTYLTYKYNASGEKVKSTMDDAGFGIHMNRYYLGGVYEKDANIANSVTQSAERLFLGGTAYDAPMVLVKNAYVNDGAWTPYNIGRDVQGSITEVLTANGDVVEQFRYDPWGVQLMVAPIDSCAVEAVDSLDLNLEPVMVDSLAVPELWQMAGVSMYVGSHGYTGHEHIYGLGLINCNARLYDPVLGRFLAPDPLIQDQASTQNFNRYTYCLNNPLKYTDPDGEFIISGTTAIVCTIIAVTGGIGVGAWKGYKIAEKKKWTGNKKVWTIIGGGVIGGLAGFAGAIAGAAAGATATAGGFIGGATVGGAAGAATGAVNGLGMTLLAGGDFLGATNQMVFQAALGGLSGALIGGLIQGSISSLKGNSFLDGTNPSNQISPSQNNSKTQLEILQENQQKHREAVDKAIESIRSKGGTNVTKEVSIDVNGTRVRIDVAADVHGKTYLYEIKTGHGGFTPNQSIAYPQMIENRIPVVPKGSNACFIFGKDAIGIQTTNYSFVIWRF